MTEAQRETLKEHARCLRGDYSDDGKAGGYIAPGLAQRVSDAIDAALAEIAQLREENQRLTEALKQMADAAEMLWVVLSNVSGSDWTKQSAEWQEAAARWRDNYFQAMRDAPPTGENP